MKLLLALIIILLPAVCWSQIGINVTGSWSEIVNQDDLTDGPGSDLNAIYLSGDPAPYVDITGAVDANDWWRVDVQRVDTTWDSSLHLYIRRTDDGGGAGTIDGGTDFVEVGPATAEFFRGQGDRTTIHLQMKITGVSYALDVAEYISGIRMTVVDF